MNIELYIANKLCDLEKSDLSIKLKRQFYTPTELNTKDAQKSYNISLPSTPTNDAIFRYSNVEEVEGKFSIYPDAKLYVNNILILAGKFRLTQITRDSYQGNLGVPAPLTAKDIFADKKMSDAGDWWIDYEGVESVDVYNNKWKDGEIAECIFPLTLYGLMPKLTQNGTEELSINDFPPSTNCLSLLTKLFDNANYKLSGNALHDECLKNLYVSFRNNNDYQMPFNYKKVEIRGKWTNFKDKWGERQMQKVSHRYPLVYKNNKKDADQQFAVCDLFQSDKLYDIEIEDETNLVQRKGNKLIYEVPISGFYKVSLHDAQFTLKNEVRRTSGYDKNDVRFYYLGHSYKSSRRDFRNVLVELKLVRTNDDTFDLGTATMDNTFYRKNQNQIIVHPVKYDSEIQDDETQEDLQDFDNKTIQTIEDYVFPKANSTNFVDSAQNSSLLCGLAWGMPSQHNWTADNIVIADRDDEKDSKNYKRGEEYRTIMEYRNYNHQKHQWCNPMALKHKNGYLSISSNSEGYTDGSYLMEMTNADSYAEIIYENQDYSYSDRNKAYKARGAVSQLVWLEAGEKITLITCCDMAFNDDWLEQAIEFRVEIEPFSPNKKWLDTKIDETTGCTIEPIDFNQPIEFPTKAINLMKFQPQDTKIDDWISNFCKAFNLELVHKRKDEFELNIKNKNGLTASTSKIIDLDQKASVWQASNENLSLPATYELGFKIDTSEQGFVESMAGNPPKVGDTGGGKFSTGSNELSTIKQDSNFSHCWYKTTNGYGNLPILTDKEIWENTESLDNIINKRYYNSAQRFWYQTDKTEKITLKGNKEVELAIVADTYEGSKTLKLNYKDEPNSIMRNYFTLLTNELNYTSVECYLSPEEYADLANAYVKFNGDLYIVAEADGYDPLGKSKTKLKLIKKF